MKKAALFLLLMLGQAWAVHALTLDQIRTQVRYNIRDTASDTSRRRYSNSVLDNLINEVQKDINNQTWAVEASTSYTLTANTTYYAMPTDYVAVKRAVFSRSGTTRELTEKSERGVLTDTPNYEATTGTPSTYFIRQAKTGAPSAQIAYLPVPTSASTGTVRVDYICQPADLSSDSDVPFNASTSLVSFHHALVYGATFRIKLLEGKTDEAQTYSGLYDRELQLFKDSISKLPNFRPSMGAGPR